MFELMCQAGCVLLAKSVSKGPLLILNLSPKLKTPKPMSIIPVVVVVLVAVSVCSQGPCEDILKTTYNNPADVKKGTQTPRGGA